MRKHWETGRVLAARSKEHLAGRRRGITSDWVASHSGFSFLVITITYGSFSVRATSDAMHV